MVAREKPGRCTYGTDAEREDFHQQKILDGAVIRE
jgi:hypothetical protein